MVRRSLLALVLIALSGCGADTGPVTAHVFGFDPARRTYGEFDAQLSTLTDAASMRGAAVTFVGGATIVGDALEATSDPKSDRILRAEGGGAPSCSFTVKDGVYHADDFDSLNMASSYYALETARQMYIGLGVDPALLNPLNAYYHPRIQMLTKVIPTFWFMVDNAAYAPPFDGFLIVPHLSIQGVPLSTNLGVMAHEYGHKVFNRLVEKGSNQQAWLKHDWSNSAAKQIRGVDEGMADVFGHLSTLDSDYIQPSIAGSDFTLDRDMAEERIMPASYAADLLVDSDGGANGRGYDPHELGGFVAAALWRLGADLNDHRKVAVAVLDVERDLGDAIAASPQYDFSTLEFLDRMAGKFTGAERERLCAILQKRFESLIDADTAHPLGNCP